MNLQKQFATQNECYIRNSSIKWIPKGVMLHSTGANNPYLCRYVAPDDGKLGVNKYGNSWNNYRPDGQQKCCHAFIGKLKDGSVATYQILPWTCKGWNNGGTSNSTHIAIEICEDGLADKTYFNKVYTEAVEVTAYLCKTYGISVKDVIDHSEGYKKGIASGHADVGHWFSKFGKTMDNFRTDVNKAMTTETKTETKKLYRVRKAWKDEKSQIGAFSDLDNAKNLCAKNPGYSVYDENGKTVYTCKAKSVEDIAKEVIAGKWGNGDERKKKLESAGYDYNKVQSAVNRLLKG